MGPEAGSKVAGSEGMSRVQEVNGYMVFFGSMGFLKTYL